MFKKKPTIKPLAPLRSSDRRKLADQIIKDFHLELPEPTESNSPEQKAEATAARTNLRNSLLPENTQSARYTTTHGPDLKQVSGTVYVGSQDGEEARILWFQVDGRTYPSIYTLWKNAGIVPLLHTPPVVIKKLQGGADLMTPGLAGGPPFPKTAKQAAVVAIASTDQPSVPVVVGTCEVDISALQSVQGAKGRCVSNMHWFGDEAWSFGASGKAAPKTPEEIEGWKRILQARGLSERMAGLDMDDDDADDAGGVGLSSNVDNETKPESQMNGNSNGHSELASTVEEVEHQELTQKEIDDAFSQAFLYGVHSHKTSNPSPPNFGLVFPLSQSYVMSNLIQPFLPTWTPERAQQLQIKKTSWKNIKKFIKALDKERLLKSKEKDGHETVILDIDFDDAAIKDFQPYRLPKKENPGGIVQGRGDQATEQTDTGDESIGQKLKVVAFYRPTSKLQPLFTTTTKQFLTPPEVREIISAYIEAEALVQENNKRLVRLDPVLANSVFDGSGSLDQEVISKGNVPRDALIDRVLHAMAPSYAIVRNSEDPNSVKAKSGAPPKVHITLETRSGNKTVTKVSGLEAYFVNPKLLADELRKVCAGSTSVEPLAGATKKTEKPIEEVMVQGPQTDAVVKALQKRGVDRKWMEVLDKTKGKKR